MEQLHCSLSNFLEQNPVLPKGTKLSIINDVALGLTYLHTHNPYIIHCDLSSNNVLLLKGMEGKICDLGTARLVDPRQSSRLLTIDFMPPDALAVTNIQYGRELDVLCNAPHTIP